MISEFSALLEFWDQDDDQKLSRSEIEAMIDENINSFQGDIPHGLDRDGMQDFYVSQDKNGDGKLSLEELVAQPVATFDCMDANEDGQLADQEISEGMSKCASLPSIGP